MHFRLSSHSLFGLGPGKPETFISESITTESDFAGPILLCCYMGSLDGVEIEFCHLYSLHLIRIRPRPLLTKNIKNRHNLSNVSSTMRVSVRSFFPSSLHRRERWQKKVINHSWKRAEVDFGTVSSECEDASKKSHNIISFLKKSEGQIIEKVGKIICESGITHMCNIFSATSHRVMAQILSILQNTKCVVRKLRSRNARRWQIIFAQKWLFLTHENNEHKKELWKLWNSRDV